jgi:uncharacterized cupredoxin-like copper-binding protein
VRRIATIAVVGLFATGTLAGCGSKKTADTTVAATETTAAAAATDTTAAAAGEVVIGAEATGTPVSVEALETSTTAFAFKLSTNTVKAGKVTITFKNSGVKQHELILLKTDAATDSLAVGTDNKVSEDLSVGEISETDAGKTVTKTFDLAAGHYAFVCNIEKHYGYGMRADFTVTP